jgi:hypothetical protein
MHFDLKVRESLFSPSRVFLLSIYIISEYEDFFINFKRAFLDFLTCIQTEEGITTESCEQFNSGIHGPTRFAALV